MPFTELTLRLLLLFLPGLLCAFLVAKLTVHRETKPFQLMLAAFVYGCLCYLLYFCIYWACIKGHNLFADTPRRTNFVFGKALLDVKVQLDFSEIVGASALAIPLGIGIGIFATRKWGYKIARFLGATNRFGNVDIWNYFLNSDEVEWVRVRDTEDDLIFEGWVNLFSDEFKVNELVLRDVKVYQNSSGKYLYDVPAVYLARKPTALMIEAYELRSPKALSEGEQEGRHDGKAASLETTD